MPLSFINEPVCDLEPVFNFKPEFYPNEFNIDLDETLPYLPVKYVINDDLDPEP